MRLTMTPAISAFQNLVSNRSVLHHLAIALRIEEKFLEMLEMLIGSYLDLIGSFWILDGDGAFDPITPNYQDRRKSRIQGGCGDLGLNQMVQTYSVKIV